MEPKKLDEPPDPLAARRADVGAKVDAYEAHGRGCGPHRDALAEALWAWGDSFVWNRVMYKRLAKDDFTRHDLHPVFHHRDTVERRTPHGNPRRGRSFRQSIGGRVEKGDRD